MNVVESFWKASPDAVLQLQQAMRAVDPAEQKRRPESRITYPGHQPQSRDRAGTGVPVYRIHRAKGLGYVRLNKRMIYLGAANTPESFERYRRVLGEWLATGRAPKRKSESTAALTVNEVVDEHLGWARRYYLDADGNPSAGLAPVEAAAKTLKALYGATVAVEFGPIAFKAVRLAMIEEGLCRNVINQRASCIKRIFRWRWGRSGCQRHYFRRCQPSSRCEWGGRLRANRGRYDRCRTNT
jgi:hypothetical protein